MSMTAYQVESFGKPLAQKLREIPQPKGREVVLRIGSCGVCHSDVHLHDGYFDLGGGHKLDMTRALQPPRTLGHEIAGTVVAVGPEAQGVQVGDKRVAFPWIGCGQCSLCAEGREHLCNRPQALGFSATAASPRTWWCPMASTSSTTAAWPKSRPAPTPARA